MEALASSTVLCIKKELRAHCPMGETNRQRNKYKAPEEVLCEAGVGINTSNLEKGYLKQSGESRRAS